MTRQEILEYWVKSSDEDNEVMETLFDKGHYAWSLFVGHLVIEKLLKAYYVKRVGERVPRIHDLTKIAELGGATLSEEQKDFLDEVSTFNIKARYPDYKQRFARKATRSFSEVFIHKIKEFRTWLKDQIDL